MNVVKLHLYCAKMTAPSTMFYFVITMPEKNAAEYFASTRYELKTVQYHTADLP